VAFMDDGPIRSMPPPFAVASLVGPSALISLFAMVVPLSMRVRLEPYSPPPLPVAEEPLELGRLWFAFTDERMSRRAADGPITLIPPPYAVAKSEPDARSEEHTSELQSQSK